MMREKKFTFIALLAIVILVMSVSVVKYRGGEVNYLNSDATWHTLLTMKAYEETPISEHKFVSIVSLGGSDNKYISWGATVPSAEGDFYYTSFSAAGYVLPYLFVKLFHLPISESALYLFNSILFGVSAILWFFLLNRIYIQNKNREIVLSIGVLTYIFSPELLHGMGIVYWHQSVMQVTLLVQIFAYYRYKVENSKKSLYVFYVFTLLNPYIEWTGYVANIGYLCVELFTFWRKDIKLALRNTIFIGILTLLSFGIFSLHYLSVITLTKYFGALRDRFFARGLVSKVELTTMFGSYFKSFLLLWLLLFALIVWNIIKTGRIELKNKMVMFILLFPLLENVLMKEHALEYTYDRMKGIFILSFLICELSAQILNSNEKKRSISNITLICVTLICCIGNLKCYTSDKSYVWSVNYRKNNEKLASYIHDHYADNILVVNMPVRGYLNLLFDQGIYEQHNLESSMLIALERKKKYVVEILTREYTRNQMYELVGARIYDRDKGVTEEIVLNSDGTIERRK